MLSYCVAEAADVVNDDDLIRLDAASWFDVNFSCDIRLVARGLHVWGSVELDNFNEICRKINLM